MIFHLPQKTFQGRSVQVLSNKEDTELHNSGIDVTFLSNHLTIHTSLNRLLNLTLLS
jgi:hypothetical protein